MKVSVCIPTYNGGEFLREAINSALAQTRPPDEVIVVDDGSTDDQTRGVCASFGDRVRYIYQENDRTLGAGARAHAMREATGDWLALLDHDDRWLPRKLERQLAAVEANPDAGLVFTRYRVIDHEGRFSHVNQEVTGEVVRMEPHEAFHLLLTENPFCPSSALVRGSFFREHGVTDPARVGCADWDLWLHISHTLPVVLVDEHLTEYRTSALQYCNDKGRLAAALERTLEPQRAHLREGCEGCREGFGRGRAHVAQVYGVAARNLLNDYHEAARAGDLARALPLLREAVRLAPSEVLSPRRSAAVLKNGLLAALRGGRGKNTSAAA
jgi:glycosyltransferase involved in cell wall biosynthesis